jgi:hypothetical protein
MIARIQRIKRDYMTEISISALIVVSIVAYAYWGAVILAHEQVASADQGEFAKGQ